MHTGWLIQNDVEYRAGEAARPGYYCRVDVSCGPVIIHDGGPLPASCDGHRASYMAVEPWRIVHLGGVPPEAA